MIKLEIGDKLPFHHHIIHWITIPYSHFFTCINNILDHIYISTWYIIYGIHFQVHLIQGEFWDSSRKQRTSQIVKSCWGDMGGRGGGIPTHLHDHTPPPPAFIFHLMYHQSPHPGAAEGTGLGFVCFVVIKSRVVLANRVYFFEFFFP